MATPKYWKTWIKPWIRITLKIFEKVSIILRDTFLKLTDLWTIFILPTYHTNYLQSRLLEHESKTLVGLIYSQHKRQKRLTSSSSFQPPKSCLKKMILIVSYFIMYYQSKQDEVFTSVTLAPPITAQIPGQWFNNLWWICAVVCTKSQNSCCTGAREISNWIWVVRASR